MWTQEGADILGIVLIRATTQYFLSYNRSVHSLDILLEEEQTKYRGNLKIKTEKDVYLESGHHA